MITEHDPISSVAGPDGVVEDPAFRAVRAAPDWERLRARLLCGPLAMTPQPLRGMRLRGSFEGQTASVVTTYKASQSFVNLSGSSYRKSVGDKVFSSPAPQAEPVIEG
ncbi:hypothetical protein I5E68_00940 [Novosphingobium sp. YJ-S2-02]|uniref:Uncharacterized protein n=1 Tax=Novosphingobium aureum TaxID=2792964 RepID=A0A931H9P9_9SPHN|nr:hypothetical protein [Novosphingobium aureum]